MEFEPSNKSNLNLWKSALAFHGKNHVELIPVIPLLFIPIWTDCYHSVLIHQFISTKGKLQPFKAIGETMRLLPSFALTKFRFFLLTILWGFLPIIGWYKDFAYRLKWAMASNIYVFEPGRSASITKRCDHLMTLIIDHKRIDALMLIPFLLFASVLTLTAMLVAITGSSLFFWIGMCVAAWIIFPGSAIVNTLVYLSITTHQNRQS